MSFRYVVMPLKQQHGPWRETRKEAVDDAVDAGLAERMSIRRGGFGGTRWWGSRRRTPSSVLRSTSF